MTDGGAGGGFWRTIPGILTATAGVVSAAAGLVIALSQAGLLGRAAGDEGPPPAAGMPIEGTWEARVAYPWATHDETFFFRVEEGRVSGSASFLAYPRGIEEGKVAGSRVTFRTRLEEIAGDERKSFENHYDGLITPRGILFSLQDTRGNEPVEFTAVRKGD